MKRKWMTTLMVALVGISAYAAEYVRTETGVYIASGEGGLRVDFVTPDIVRVRYTQEGAFLGNGTIACLERQPSAVPLVVKQDNGRLVVASDSIRATINLQTQAISFSDAVTGRLLLQEADNPRTCARIVEEKVTYDERTRRTIETADGRKEVMDVLRRDTIGHTWRMSNHFRFQQGEALYGLGSHMEDYLNLRGKTLYLCQHNLKAMVPVLNSTAGYGLLFDAGCSMVFSDEKADDAYVELEAAREIDYYLMKGRTMDRVVAQYRMLTGDVPMLPQYMFGYIQSKERYRSSDELMQTVAEYRRRQVPLDVIVQDWNYWPQGWGYIKMDPKFYPDRKLLADSIHAMKARLMVSIWPNPSYCPQADDFKQRGFMLSNSVYDAYNPLARRHYWQYVNNEFFSQGFDAWWCDCTEPLDADWGPQRKDYGWNNQKERWQRNTQLLSDALGAERAATFSLNHSRGLYENQRLTTSEKRVVNLTRSSFAGQQRYATITWNGDTHASWASFRQQIPAGLNFMATGCNYWTVDAGAFFTRKDPRWFYAGEFPEGAKSTAYREFYTRMLQYATFLPLQRSHGTDTPREIWQFGNPGEPFYEAILKMIRLRYQLLPYTYSMADQVTHNRYTMTRLLAFDFASDPEVLDLKDEFMFGPSLLVCPVTEPNAQQRSVYLPKANGKGLEVRGEKWVDFWTDKVYDGGQRITADAPIDRLPLFVRAGSILPMGPVVQYTAEAKGKAIDLHIYPGGDAQFTLYSDEGDSYRYEQGDCQRISIEWHEKSHKLTIGSATGSYQGAPQNRTFRIVLHKGNGKTAEREVNYSGKATSYKL